MRIGAFTDTYIPQKNGVVVFLSKLLLGLARENKVVLFAPATGKPGTEQVSRNFRIRWLTSRPFPFYDGYRIATANYLGLVEMLADEKVDIIHCHAPVVLGVEAIFAAKQLGIPVVATYHTHLPDYIPHLLKGRLPAFLKGLAAYPVKKLIKFVFSSSDHTTAPTRLLVNELRSYGVANATCLAPGIDLKRFRCSRADVPAFLRKNRIPEGARIVLYTGRASFEKRIDVLLKAFWFVEDKDTFLLIVGDGPYLKKYRRMAAELKLSNVRFTGFVDDAALGTAYACASVFASASDTETFGLTFVEAMSAGVPVVGVRKLGAAEVIRNGKNGFLVQPGDYRAMAGRIRMLLSDVSMRRRLSRCGIETVKRYSMGVCVKKTLALYAAVLKEKSKGLNIKKYK